MDEVDNGFGSLSMSAAEWKPSSNRNSSDLNAGGVNEFKPGQGWNTAASYVATTNGRCGVHLNAQTEEHSQPCIFQ